MRELYLQWPTACKPCASGCFVHLLVLSNSGTVLNFPKPVGMSHPQSCPRPWVPRRRDACPLQNLPYISFRSFPSCQRGRQRLKVCDTAEELWWWETHGQVQEDQQTSKVWVCCRGRQLLNRGKRGQSHWKHLFCIGLLHLRIQSIISN